MSKNRKKVNENKKIVIGLPMIFIIMALIFGAIIGLSIFKKSTSQTGSEIGNSLAAKPSAIFDAEGTNADGLHIGDFVNYDAGTWTQEEINSILTANGTTELPTGLRQFGGFTAGMSRNENATPYYTTANYVKDAETGEAVTGWRVFDVEGDTVTLISAGNPEDYHPGLSSSLKYIDEYILTGNINSSWSTGATESSNYQKRDWSVYVNESQKAENAQVLTKSKLDSWYTKYTNTANADTGINETFRKIYTDTEYQRYQNMIDNYSYYWLCVARSNFMKCVKPSRRVVSDNDCSYGVRVLVSLSSDVILSKKGIKTITGGNTTSYGGDQTYNTWDIVIDKTPPNPGTISASATYTNQSTVTVYVTAPYDNETGINRVEINGWYGEGWNGHHQGKIATYDSANNRYYATFTFSEMPNTTTGATNQGQGMYSIDAHVYDNAGNESNPGAVRVYYDTTAPTCTSYEIKNQTKDGYDVYVYGASDAISGVNRVVFPTWTDANGQDDLVSDWYTSQVGTNQGNGTWYFRVNASDHNNEEGTYSTHIYMYDNAGNSVCIATTQTYVDKTPPTCTSYEIKNVTKDGYDVYVYGVSDDNSGVNRVSFPTWTDANGQDDLASDWYTSQAGTNQGNGTWYYRANTSNHNNETGNYITHIYMYDNAGNVSQVISTQTYVDTTLPNGGTTTSDGLEIGQTADGAYIYAINKEEITIYIIGASDASGIANVYINGWTGGTYVEYAFGITAEYDETNDRYYATFNINQLPNTTTGITNNGEATYFFDAHVVDNYGNENISFYTNVIYDKTAPIIFTDTNSTTWQNTALNVTITVKDPLVNESASGLDSNNIYEYYLSRSSTELIGGEWTTYTSGEEIILDPKVSGTYYLFAKSVSDKLGNTSEGITLNTLARSFDTYHLLGTYQFDYDSPTVGTLTMKTGSIDGDDYISNTVTTQNVFIYANDGTDSASGHASTTYSINGGDPIGSGIENATELTEQGLYYITVTTKDVTGNTATSSDYVVNINISTVEPTEDIGNGTINPIYRPVWTKLNSSIDVDSKTLTVTIKGSAYTSEIIDNNVEIKYASDVISTLSDEDITVFIDGVEVTSTANPLVKVDEGVIEVNTDTGKTEVTHVLQLTNFKEAVRQAGIPYNEWSGNVSLKIGGRGQSETTYTADVLTDEYGNQNMMETDQNGTNADGTWIDIKLQDEEIDQNTDGIMFADFIKPEFTYKYSEADINYTGKTVKIVFSVTDKYFKESTLTIDDLTILVDGENPDWATAEEALGVGNTKPVKEILSVTDVTTTLNGIEKVVGKEYTLLIRNLSQPEIKEGDNYLDYSGYVTLGIQSGKAVDTSGNTSNGQTIVVGIEITGDNNQTPSNLFDVNGINPDGLHIGDFINYDAGTWTQDEINKIQTGEIANLVTANGTTELPTEAWQFGGFTANSSKNESVTPYNGTYNYVKDETGETISGWRVFDINEDTITLISAGNPEAFYNTSGTNYSYISEYILTGNVNRSWSNGIAEISKYQIRDWSNYINKEQRAESATILDKDKLNDWYAKYTSTANANVGTTSIFQQIYDNTSYYKYQNLIDNYSWYWLATAGNSTNMNFVDPSAHRVNNNNSFGAYGIRVLVILSPSILLEKTGTKTVTVGSLASGETQTYNVWRIDLSKEEIIETEDEPTYIPEGYTHVEGTTMEDGYVIEDGSKNQYVWIEVPKTLEVYRTAGLNVREFTDEEYKQIEQDLRKYTEEYESIGYSDAYVSDTIGLTETEYNIQKQKMLKSIYRNGGFYIGRYETGIDYEDANGYRTATGETIQTPVIKQNAYPYNYVTISQAQELAESFSTTEYTTSLMFGVQWDLILKYLVNKGITISASWGNFRNNSYTLTNESSKYSLDNGNEWKDGGSYKKPEYTRALLTTGADEKFNTQNIYDLAGNVEEYTFEVMGTNASITRGYSFYEQGNASYHNTRTSNYYRAGFRVALYKDEGTESEEETTTHPELVDVVDPLWEMDDLQVDKATQRVSVNLTVTDKYYYENTLTEDDIKIYDETGTELVEVEKQLTAPIELKEKRIVDGVEQEVQYGMQYTLVLTNWQEEIRRTGKLYKEYSGSASIVISEGVVIDTSGNTNKEQTFSTGEIDFLLPEFTYIYSGTSRDEEPNENPEIDYDGKKVTIVFAIADKNFDNTVSAEQALKAEELTILIDGKEPEWRAEGGTTGVTRTLTSKEITEERTKEDGTTETVVVGYEYSLILEHLEQEQNDGYDYSGIISIGIPSKKFADKFGNESNAQTITVGTNILGEPGNVTGIASEIFDENWVDTNKLHIGDFIEYDAGTWTQDEINAIETGKTSGTVIANGKTSLPSSAYQFGGFTAGSSRNGNVTSYSSTYNYLKDKLTESVITGWRVFDISDDGTLTLISAGNPEAYYHGSSTNGAYISEYILTGNVNNSWANGQTESQNYIKRDWSNYINTEYKAQSATVLTKTILDNWYAKYITAESANTSTKEIFQKIYTDSAKYRYQNIVDNHSYYWISSAQSNNSLMNVNAGERYILGGQGAGYGVRVLVTLSSDVQLAKTGTKTITGGNMNSYGGDYAYNVWEIQNDQSSTDTGTTTLPSTEYTKPYLPENYSYVEGDLETGLVIKDKDGNEYVWVEVPKTEEVYQTAGLEIDRFTDEEYTKIYEDLATYTSTIRISSTNDNYVSESVSALTENEFNTQKKKMLKSIYKNGGFYVGRYETGTETTRISTGALTQTPVIKQNVYPYYNITSRQAQILAETFKSEGYEASLMFGIQWDLILRYLNAKGTTIAEIRDDSSSWGNYRTSEWNITTGDSKYTTNGITWTSGTYGNKQAQQTIGLTTGASDTFSKQNIYDLAGNVEEWVLDHPGNSTTSNKRRGGNYYNNHAAYSASYSNNATSVTAQGSYTGFRVCLYKDEGIYGDEVVVDVVDPIVLLTDEGLSIKNEENILNIDEKTVTVVVKLEDKYLAEGNLLKEEYINQIKVQIEENDGDIIEDASNANLKIIKPDGTIIEDQTELNNQYSSKRIIKTVTEVETTDNTITYKIVLGNFGKFEGKVSVVLPKDTVLDESGNGNKETPVLVGNSTYTTVFKDSIVDFVRPTWNYVSADTTKLETEGKISFEIKGTDLYLDTANSILEASDIRIVKDGEIFIDGTNALDSANIIINRTASDETERSVTYTVEISGVSETGTYSLVLAKDTLVDENGNTSIGTTITFSNAEMPENTERYGMITYHVALSVETQHETYVHELIEGDTSTYRPSTLGELFNNGENPLFIEPEGQSFAGWAEADESGDIIEGGTTYGLYDEIPKTVTHLRAVWQDATVIYVSASTGDNSNDGTTPETPVKDLETAYAKLNAEGNATNNIIVIMDAVEYNNTATLTGNATITSLYGGVDYEAQGAELKVSSNMTIAGDITFDNIKLYTDEINNKLVVNSETEVILGRGITTPSDKYTFGAISGGNLEPETIILETGKYNNIVAGSISSTGTTAGTTHKVVIGNKRDSLIGNNSKLEITSENTAIYLRALNGITAGTVDFEMYSGKVNGDIYGGSSTTGANITNNLTFYGGEIAGDIYGGGINGTSGNVGTTKIVMKDKTCSQIVFDGSIYGTGINETTTNSSIYLENFGTVAGETGTAVPHKMTSIEMADNLYIGNSCIELTGTSNETNLNPQTSYTLSKLGALTIYDNTTLYTQRGFNQVEEFNSYLIPPGDGTGTLATIANSDNRLYTLEGVNLIFATEEGDLSDRNTEDIWGDVNGMTMFGVYTENEAGEKLYDETLFTIGTYVEGREKTNHDITVDGFYTSAKQVIDVTDNGTNYDWILGENVVNYEVQLIASASGKDGVEEVVLDYNYLPEATYTLTGISTNALINANNIDVNLVDPLTIPITSENANNTFGLTVETTESGWYSQSSANIYKDSFEGDTLFESDNSDKPGAIRFKIHNSSNITEENDLGFINLILTGTKPSDLNPDGETFTVIVAINIQTIVEAQVNDEQDLQYTPIFTGREESELNYTTDSKVDITYTLYNELEQTPYTTGDYRVLTSTTTLPAGTRITMKDLVQGKIYYYHVTGTETEYRLSNFLEMDSTDNNYVDTNTYYNGTYALEKYEFTIDYLDANISANRLAQEMYLELRSADGTVKYDNGDISINYNLYYNKNAVMTETISNESQTYEVQGDIEIPFTLNVSLLEQETTNAETIMDTKYYDKIEGIAIEILDENGRRLQDVQNFTITNQDNIAEKYEADSTGVIRIPVMEGLSSIAKNYIMTINENSAQIGTYTVTVYFFASDDGKYVGNEENVQKEFYLTFNTESGAIAIDATDESRIINKETGLNLEGNNGIDMQVTVGNPTNTTNVRIELYKRNQTYTDINDENSYTGTQYTLVDITNYLNGEWQTPESAGLASEIGSIEYVLLPKQDNLGTDENITIDLQRALKENVSTGEYKLVIKLYDDNTLIETARKTFIVTN